MIVIFERKNRKTYIRPNWWDEKDLRAQYDFISEGDNYYIEDALYVDKTTFNKIINDQENKFLGNDVYSLGGWIKINNADKRKLENLLKRMADGEIVKILISE